MNNYNITFSQATTYVDSFIIYLQEQGYKNSTQKIMNNAVNYFLRSALDNGQMLFTENSIFEFVDAHYDKYTQKSRYNSVLGTCLRFYSFILNGNFSNVSLKSNYANLSQFTGFEPLIDSFIVEQSIRNKPSTLLCKQKTLRKFALFLLSQNVVSICNIKADNIFSFLEDKSPETAAIVRSFLRYLFINKRMEIDLSVLIYVAKRDKKLPTTYTEQEIQALLKVYDGKDCVSIRNKAIILLTATTGMRSCDIVHLKYSDFCFENNTVNIVQLKTGVPLTLPISTELAALVKQYYITRKKGNSDKLFINQNAPFNAISTGIIRYILKKAFTAAQINITGRKHGPHSLRSTLASAMINSGVSYDVVQKQLGHTSDESLTSYVKIDVEKLRLCALKTQPATGNFKTWLEEHI